MIARWISGPVRSGKTSVLIRDCAQLMSADQPRLLLAANADNRQQLLQRITSVTRGQVAVHTTTPLAFFEDEVLLFWPLLIQALPLKAHFPVRLRPETEQALASQFWGPLVWEPLSQIENLSRDRWVRRVLDLLQLAAFSGTPLEALPARLAQGFAPVTADPALWEGLGQMLLQWRGWCLERGLLTYGLITELYWRYLLPDPTYQGHLLRRFQGVFADDVDNYPAIARPLLAVWLDAETTGVFTFNPAGAIRLGLGGDPEYLLGLRDRCQLETLLPLDHALGIPVANTVIQALSTPGVELPATIQSLQTSSRAQLLRQTAATIVEFIQSGAVKPQEIAIIGPGLDTIARYTLGEILAHHGIAVTSLQDQRPLYSTAIIRALLTLLALVYPGLGRLVDRDQIAEMLIVLTTHRPHPASPRLSQPVIDPVRAGLLADHCFQPHPELPQLLSVTAFPRWDRLGHAATAAYDDLRHWVEQQRATFAPQAQPYLTLSPVFILDRAIHRFLNAASLTYDQLAVLRELIETAQHYWQVNERLRQTATRTPAPAETVGQFIQLLRQGTITANPFPIHDRARPPSAVMLSTTFQYRMARQVHRWHFWLDTGSTLWHGGGAVVLWGAPLLLRHWSGIPLTVEDELRQDQEQLERLLQDLLSRATERVFLCYSELSVSGQEQVGPLLPVVDLALPLA